MIDALINILDQAAASLSVATRHGIAELKPNPSGGTVPMVHRGAGEWQPIADDTAGTWSYWRMTDGISSETVNLLTPCDGVRYTIRLRLVMYVDREGPCEDMTKAMTTLTNSIRANTRTMRTALNAVRVEVRSANAAMTGVDAQEFGTVGMAIPTNRSLVALDLVMVVDGTESCILGCGDAVVIECEPTDCPTITVNGTESETPTITVVQGGDPVGTFDPETGVVTVDECPENCPFDIELYVDSVLVDTIDDVDPCVNNTLNINWN